MESVIRPLDLHGCMMQPPAWVHEWLGRRKQHNVRSLRPVQSLAQACPLCSHAGACMACTPHRRPQLTLTDGVGRKVTATQPLAKLSEVVVLLQQRPGFPRRDLVSPQCHQRQESTGLVAASVMIGMHSVGPLVIACERSSPQTDPLYHGSGFSLDQWGPIWAMYQRACAPAESFRHSLGWTCTLGSAAGESMPGQYWAVHSWNDPH